MSKGIAFFVLVALFVATPIPSMSQPHSTNGMRGTHASAKRRNFKDLPIYTPDPTAPIREVRELEAPYSPVVPPVDISNLNQVTMDPSGAGSPTPSPTAPSVGSVNFEGITQGGFIPSEPTVAAGPLNIFTIGNSSITVTNKDGSNRTEVNGLTFFGGPVSEVAISDGVCMYDARRGHFIAVAFTTDQVTYSHMYIAVSQTNDARGAWYQYVSDFRVDGVTPTTFFADYEEIGISDDKFVISSQQFNSSGVYQYQKVRVWDINQIESGTASSFVDFANYQGTKRFVTKPGRNLGSVIDSTIYLLSVPNGGGTSLFYGYITGTAASPVMNWSGGGTAITVQTYSTVVNAPGLASGTLGDDRTFNFVVRNHTIYQVAHFSVVNGTTVDAIRLWEIDVSNKAAPSLLKDETFVSAPSSLIFYYYPSVAVDSVGTVYVGFDRSAGTFGGTVTEFSSGWATGERRSDANMQASVLVKGGTATSTQTRWGDYTGADMDETASGPGGSTAWIATQWTKSATVFGTWINQLTFPYNQITGQVLLDADGSTGTSGDRSALAGWTVTLKQGVTTLGTSVSDAMGNYRFGYLENGTYTLILTQQAGNTAPLDVVPGSGGTSQTRIDSLTIQVSVAMSATLGQISAGNNFLQKNSLAAISGRVYYDMNGNGTREGGEPGLAGWTVTISGDSSGSTISDANGDYVFQNVPVGNYTISETVQGGYTESQPGGNSYPVTISSGTQQSSNNDFGNFGKIWTGGASTTNWGDAGNWNPSGAPGDTNEVYLTGANTIDVNVAGVCKNLYLQNSGLTLTVKSGNSLSVNGKLVQLSGTLNTEAAFPTVSGTTTISGGTIGYTASSGSQTVSALPYQTLVISGGGTKTLAGTTSLAVALSVNGGTFNLAGQSFTLTNALNQITVANGATLQTGGTVIYTFQKVTLGASSTIDYSGGTETILPPSGITGGNYGNLTASGSGQKTLTANVTVTGILALNQVVNAGGFTLTIGGAGSVTRTTGYVLGAFAKTILAAGAQTWEVGSATDYLPISMNVSSLAGGDVIKMTLSSSNPATTFTGTASKAIGHYYTIAVGAGITAITAIPTLSFTSAEFGALTGTGGDQTKLFLASWSTGSWISQRTNSTLASAASGGTPGTVTLVSGVSSFSPWAIFWGVDDSPLQPPASLTLKTWVGSGNGGTGTDFNAGANWSPAATPTSADSCYIPITASPTITLSSSATVGALTVALSGGSGRVARLDAATNILTVIKTMVMTSAGGTAASNNQLQFNVGNSPGQIVLNGSFTTAGATNATIVFPLGIGGSTGQVILKANATFGTSTFTSAANQPSTVIFDAPVSQTINSTSASVMLLGSGTTHIGSQNNPTVTVAGTATGIRITGDLRINGSSVLDLSTVAGAMNRSAAGGTLTLASAAKLRLAAASGGQTGSNFPSLFTTYTLASGSTVEYYGTAAQTVFGGAAYSKLLLTATSARTATAGAGLTVTGDLTIGSSVTFSGSTFTHTVGGNWSNGGSYTPGTGTVAFNASIGTQTVDNGGSAFNNLTHSGAGSLQLINNNLTVNGALTNSAGTLDAATNSKNISVGGNWSNTATFSPGTTTTTFTGASGTQTLNNGSSTFKNLTHAGAGTLQLATNDLTVSGNLTNSSGTLDAATNNKNISLGGNWSNSGTFLAGTAGVTLNGGAGQTMSGSTFNNLTIDDPSGVTMLTDETVNGALTIANGSLTTGANTVTLGPSGTLTEGAGKTVVGNIQTTRNVSATSGTQTFGGLGADLTLHGTAPGITLMKRVTGTASTGNAHNSILRFFDISPTVNTGLNADLRYHYDGSELNGQAENTLELYKSPDNGATWTNRGGTTDTAANTVTAPGLDGFSRWTASNTSNALGSTPVPTTTSISPTSKTVGDPAFILTVSGTNFVSGKSTVQLNGSGRTTTFVSETQLTAAIPASDLQAAGTPAITVFNSDGGGASNAQTLTINKANVTPTLASSPNPSTFEQAVTFTARFIPSTGSGVNPGGTVAFYDGGNSLGTQPLTGDSAVLVTANLTAGSHPIKAVYGGDGNFNSDSATITQTVNQGTPTVTLHSSQAPSTFGQTVTFTAHVHNASNTPTGSVTFYDGATTFGSAPLVGDSASTSTAGLASGIHTVKAVYGGDASFVSDSASISQTVNQSATTTSVDASPNPSVFGHPVSFTATVTAVSPGSGTPSGSIVFKDGASPLDTATLNGSGQASFNTSSLSAGIHSITGTYSGSSDYSGSVSAAYSDTVNTSGTVVSLSPSLNPSVFGQSVTFTAHVTNGGTTPTGTIVFKDGASPLDTAALDTSGTATFTTSALQAGIHPLVAFYSGDANHGSSSSPVLSDTVKKGSTTATLASSLNPSTFGQSVTFTSKVSVNPPGAGTPDGSVTFYDGAAILGTVPLAGDSAEVSTAALTGGAHAIKAVYGGSSNFTADSASLAQVINRKGTAGFLTSVPNPSSVGQAITVRDSVTGPPDGGKVYFRVDGTTIDSANVNGTGIATMTTSALTNGPHSIVGYFGGTTNYDSSSSNAVAQTVNQIVITASAGPNGSISPSGSVPVSYNGSRHFTFTPNTGYHVDSLLIDGINNPDSLTGYTFASVTVNHSISVKFAINNFTIAASAGAHGIISPNGSVGVNYGASQRFTFTPDAGYHVDSVLADGVNNPDSTNGYTFTNVTANHAIVVKFAINKYTITATAGANGSVAPSGAVMVNYGTSQQFTFTPAAGYHVDSVLADGVNRPDSTSGFTFVNVTANHSLLVKFAINTYTITASAGANGAIAPSGSIVVNYGGSQLFTFTPDPGYAVDSVVVDGARVPTAPNHTFSNVTANHTIRVTFASNTFSAQVIDGWNMISDPRTSADPRKTVLYPAAITKAFAYVGIYQTRDSVLPGTGYWLKFSGAQTVHVDGPEILNQSVPVGPRWNMIGSISQTVSVASIVQSPPGIVTSQYYSYSGAYDPTSTIVPGQAVWVKTNLAGTLTMSGSAGAGNTLAVKDPGMSDALLDSLNTLTIQPLDGAGRTGPREQRLYFREKDGSISLDRYDLPPVPPEQGFDARFGSNRTVEEIVVEGESAPEIPVRVQSATMKFALSWNIKAEGSLTYDLVEKKERQVVRTSRMSGSGSIEVDAGSGITLAIRAARVPRTYVLKQNYPNPFNPVTNFEYLIPVQSKVTLRIYNILGQLIATLVDRVDEPGVGNAQWDASGVSSGLYFYRLDAVGVVDPSSKYTEIKKMVLVK